jgi:hypothetical protein
MSRAAELVAAFDVFTGNYKREEMEAALTLQEEITPLLLDILDQLAADPEGYVTGNHFAETYAVALLAHFRETRAHLPIIYAFSIPDEQRECIWADMLTETLPALLCRTSGGDYNHVLALVRNKEAYEFLRASAMETLKLGITCGDLTREEGLAHYASLFDESLAEPGDYFWASLVCDLLDLYPGELIADIRGLFAKGFVHEGEVSLAEVERTMSKGYDVAVTELDQKLDGRLPENVHDYLTWFACFHEERSASRNDHQASLRNSLGKKKNKAKNKRKQAKLSKRKNRR